jgi:hypothetical protein
MPLSRRQFIGLMGLVSAAGGVTCITSALGYLVVEDFEQKPASSPVPSSTPPRSDAIKQIDRPTIITRAEWGAREPDHEAENEKGFYSLENVEGWREYEGDLRDIYNTVVIHHSVIYEGDDLSTIQEIQNEHMDDRKWADIGYHFGVGQSGQIFEGRDMKVRGTHVEQYNTGSVGVVFFGNFEIVAPPLEQLEAGRQLINWLALRLELNHLAGHRDFNDFTVCPGDNMYFYLEAFATSAGLILGTGGYEPPPEQLITPTPTEAPPP